MESLDAKIQKNLPNATAVLILGISSIPLCCCFGGVAGLILGIVGLILANKDLGLYAASPDSYTSKSYNNLKAGRICAIIGLIFSILYVMLAVWLIMTFGWEVLSNPEKLQELIQERFS